MASDVGIPIAAAYADPPYLGQGKKKYSPYHIDAADFDEPRAHQELARNMDASYGAWALSMSSANMQELLPLMPSGVRIAAWVKPFASFKPSVDPAYAWEPVVFKPADRLIERDTVRDWAAINIAIKKGLPGAKPPQFCQWLFQILRLIPGDTLIDMFPGTGVVSCEWRKFQGGIIDEPGTLPF